MSEQDKAAARERGGPSSNDSQPPRYSFSGPGSSRPPPPAEASSTSSSNPNHPHAGGPPPPHHHHHSHHHHHHHHAPHLGLGGGPGSSGGSDRTSAPPQPPSTTHEASRVPGSGLSSAYPSSRHGSASTSSASTGAPPPSQQQQPPPSGRSSLFGGGGGGGSAIGGGNSGTSTYPFGNYMAEKRERERLREIERERERERERQQKGPETSPGRTTAPPPYPPRNIHSTSPTMPTRPPPPSSIGGPAPPPKTTNAPPPPPSSASSVRPGVPLPSFSSLNSRALGSAYNGGRERSGSTSSVNAQDKGLGHNRNLSTSSQPRSEGGRGGLSSIGQTSPVKSSAPTPSAAGRGLFGGPPPLSQPPSRDTQRSPVQHTSSVTSPTQLSRDPPSAASAAKSGPGGPPSASSNRPPYSFSSTYASAYTQPYTSYGLGGGSFLSGSAGGASGSYPYSYANQDRERREREQRELREREKEREKERERERDRERERERERREREDREARLRQEMRQEKERWDKDRERRAGYGVETKPFQPPRQTSTAYNDIYRPRPPANQPLYPETKYTRHIEVINRPEAQPYAPETKPAPPPPQQSQPPPLSTANQPPASSQPPPPAGLRDPRDARQQYAQAQAQAQAKAAEREYTYTPRDTKRSRMDVAVEEQAQSNRRPAGSRKKARKEEDKKEKPPARDWSLLTNDVKRWPEVSSAAIEAWLKSAPETSRVAGETVYDGPAWSLSQTPLMCPENEGATVTVRINSAFLGQNWRVRGDPGWDEATPLGDKDSVVGLGWEEGSPSHVDRRIWGTDVYTDDSDLGLVLIHAGWVRWGGSAPPNSTDGVQVTVRIVPTLVRYTATERNGIVSRGWGNSHDGASIVVESVKSVKFVQTPKVQTTRRLRIKQRLAERFREFQAITAAQPQLITLEPGPPEAAPQSPGLNILDISGEGRFKFTPAAVDGWLNPPGDDTPRPTMWTHDLQLSSGRDRYFLQLFLSDEGAPRIDCEHITPLLAVAETSERMADHPCPGTDSMTPLAQGLHPAKCTWVPEGLVLDLQGSGTVLLAAEWFAWTPRVNGPVSPAYLDRRAAQEQEQEEQEARQEKQEVDKQEERQQHEPMAVEMEDIRPLIAAF